MVSAQDSKPIKLTTYRYSAQNCKGVIIFFHSMAYYMGVYGDVAKQFAAAGYTFVGYDLRGHGRS